MAAAEWALAREAAAQERWDEAVSLGERFLRAAAADDPLREDAARALIDLRNQADDRQAAQAARVRLGLVLVALSLALVGLIALGRRLRGRSVTAALARLPDLYPEVALVIAEIRHDVLKHRASALGMLGAPDAPRGEVARALLEPTPTSAVVAAAFERLLRAAAAAGVPLRPLPREPLFGPLHRALTRAEALLAAGSASRAGDRELLALDRELRERHGPALAALLAVAPRTRLDPAAVAAWLRPVADGANRAGAVTPACTSPPWTWTSPSPPRRWRPSWPTSCATPSPPRAARPIPASCCAWKRRRTLPDAGSSPSWWPTRPPPPSRSTRSSGATAAAAWASCAISSAGGVDTWWCDASRLPSRRPSGPPSRSPGKPASRAHDRPYFHPVRVKDLRSDD